MNNTGIKERNNFGVRIGSMLRLDFYRLFHTPVFYIMLAISAIIPAMVLCMTGSGESTIVYTNAFQLIAASTPTYIVSDFGEYANINMVYIFAGILLSIFIGHDYLSGFVKNVFTVHSKKMDYAISKTAIGIFSTACMIGTYFIGTAVSGLLTAKSFEVSAVGLICCLMSKLALSVGFSALFVAVNVFFRRFMGLSIAGSFFFGTGMLVMGAAAVLSSMGMESLLNVFLYGSACSASLTSNGLTIIFSLLCSFSWAVIYTLVSTFVLNHRDLV